MGCGLGVSFLAKAPGLWGNLGVGWGRKRPGHLEKAVWAGGVGHAAKP